mgnify:FL=1
MPFIFLLLCSLVLTSTASANIGSVILHEGSGAVERTDGEQATTEVDLQIFSYDTIKTGQGKTAVEFIDETRVDVTQHSKLIIDEFVYDPKAKTGKLSLN